MKRAKSSIVSRCAVAIAITHTYCGLSVSAHAQDARAASEAPVRAIAASDDIAKPEATDASETASIARWLDDLEWMAGVSLASAPTYLGSDREEWKLRPIWSVRYGRFIFTGPRSSAGRTFADDAPTTAGASAAVFEDERWRASLGFRIDGGRSASVDPRLAGLPEVKRRGIYSLSLRYKLSDEWSASATASSDVRSAETGSTLSLGVGHSKRIAPRWMWSSGLGTTIADHHYMEAYHGVRVVPPGSSLTLFRPGGGVRDVSVGTTLRYQYDRHWVGFVSAGTSRLLGDAADSPLTSKKQQSTLMLGIAYNSERKR